MTKTPEELREYVRRIKAKVRSELEVNPDDPRHGRDGSYANGCRCDRCRTAHREAERDRAARKRLKQGRERYERPPDPRYEMIREMRLAGATNAVIATQLGYSSTQTVSKLAKKLGLSKRKAGRRPSVK